MSKFCVSQFCFILGGKIFNQLILLVPLRTPLAVQTVGKALERETPLHPAPRLNFQAEVELCKLVKFTLNLILAGAGSQNPFGDDDDEYDSSGKNPFAD